MKYKNTGFAILEVLISVLIVSFGVLALAKFQANLHANQDTATHRTQAQGLGMEVVNKVAAQEDPSAYPAGTDSVTAKSTQYTRDWTVQPDVMGSTLVEVKVSWTNSRGQNDFVQLATLVAKDTLTEQAKLVASPTPPMTGTPADQPKKAPPWFVDTSSTPTTPPTTPPTTTPPVEPPTTVPPPEVKYTISGVFEVDKNVDIDKTSWTVSASGASCTNTKESYSCTVSSGWSGSVTTKVTGGSATPASSGYANVLENKVTNIRIRKN